uniref:Uncharacterized protein n=1 Tax=Mycena chlorophos TaxID=658473 RepID=A0ABQ0KZY3_MYCCL|nr:predicted protein [Mycena chlorophos]
MLAVLTPVIVALDVLLPRRESLLDKAVRELPRPGSVLQRGPSEMSRVAVLYRSLREDERAKAVVATGISSVPEAPVLSPASLAPKSRARK